MSSSESGVENPASPTLAALQSHLLGDSESARVGQQSPQPTSLASLDGSLASLDGSASFNGSLDDGGGRSELQQLQAALAAAQAQVRAMEAKVSMWEECMRTLVYCVMLSPDMNDIYKQECVELLQNTLVGVEQVTDVHYVECSFPSVPSEAPRLQLELWDSLEHSEWSFRWSPSWSIQARGWTLRPLPEACEIPTPSLAIAGGIGRLVPHSVLPDATPRPA